MILNGLKTFKDKTKFTYDDYLKLTPEEQVNIGNKEWHDLTPEERMLILENWDFSDVIKDYKGRLIHI